MKTLFLTLILSPLAFAQTKPGKPPAPSPPAALPLINDQFTAATMRPEKIAGFKARAAELNRRSIALAEEERLWNIKATKEMKANNANAFSNPGGAGSIQTGPRADPKHLQSLKTLRDETRIFQRDIIEEMKLRNQQIATAETNRKAITLKQANQAGAPAVGAVTQAPTPTPTPKPGEALPVGKAVPSSVPGLPAGLEPSKQPQQQQQQQQSGLPPGVSRK